ncbi:MAG: penicillin-binding protein [Roseivirga sp.]
MAFKHTILLRTRIAFLAVFLFAIAITFKLVYIQFFQGARWKKAAEVTGLEYRPIKATRGNIYAADGSLLATSLPFYRVALDPCIVDDATFQAHIGELSQLLASFYQDKSAATYQELIQNARQAGRRYLVLNKRHINYAEKNEMSQWPIFCQGRWQGGVVFEKTEKRVRPFQELAARTIGYVNENEYGPGLEYTFHQDLKGLDGKALYQKTVGGNWKMIHNGAANRPVPGYDITTTIDINLQDVAHSSLLEALQASQAQYGCAMVMEVQTGEIKAMANLGRTASGQYAESYNYAAGNQGTTEPGSTFKLVSMLALLEETSVALTDTIDTGEGEFQFYDKVMKDVKRSGFGELTVQEVFEKSSNVGMSRLIDEAFGDHPQKFVDYVHKLGLHKPLGFQIVGEGVPLVKKPGRPGWSGVTLHWMSIGYALKITPLQTLTLYNAVANNGKMVRPFIVKNIKQANRVVKTFQGGVLNKKICSDATLQKLKVLLEGTIAQGTARKIRHSFYKTAGKSGTANKVVDGKYTKDTSITFVGYFPAEAPRYSCLVLMDSPKGYAWHFGADIARVFKNIVDKIAAQDLTLRDSVAVSDTSPKDVPLIRAGKHQDLVQLCDQLTIACDHQEETADWVRSRVEEDRLVWQSNGNPGPGQVPHVVGMKLRDALFLLESRGLKVVVQGPQGGIVKTQSLLPGTSITPGRSLTLQMR